MDLFDYLKQPDKILHFLVGVLIALSVSIINVSILPLLCASLAAFGKECYDEVKYGKFDMYDAIFTISGGLYAQIILWII